MNNILIIEDDIGIAEIERDYLELSGFQVKIVTDGAKGLEEGLSGEYDLVLLDLMLPGPDGFTICKTLRESLDIPILIVTARLEDIDKIRGLGVGADDYIEKPFSLSVLVARIKAHLTRYARLKAGGKSPASAITIDGISVDTATREATVSGKKIELKKREYELLVFFMSNPNVVFSREFLYEKLWGMDAMGDNATVAVHINRLREKVESDPANPKYIQTVWGAGYVFRTNGAEK